MTFLRVLSKSLIRSRSREYGQLLLPVPPEPLVLGGEHEHRCDRPGFRVIRQWPDAVDQTTSAPVPRANGQQTAWFPPRPQVVVTPERPRCVGSQTTGAPLTAAYACNGS